MFTRLFGTSRRAAPRPAAPEGARIYAIGDVHGMRRELDVLLDRIVADDAGRGDATRTIVFLGDLIDRGPDSAGVVERCRTLQLDGFDVRFLLGNHEEVLLSALDGDRDALRLFSRIGGRETMRSYGISDERYDQLDFDELAVVLRDTIPESHRAFLAQARDQIILGDYAFVHAGIRPGVALADQQPQDLRWIRKLFLDYVKPHEKVIVHGHTVTDEPELLANRIGIDTGAYRNGVLTALGVEQCDQWILQSV